MFREIEVLLRLPNDDEGRGILIYVPEGEQLLPAQLDTVLDRAEVENEPLLNRHGFAGLRVGDPRVDERPIGAMRVRVRADFGSPGERDWSAYITCQICEGSSRRGFGGRLPCFCADGASAYMLDVAEGQICVFSSSATPSTRWRCRLLAPTPMPIDVNRWIGWTQLEDRFVCEPDTSWGSMEEAIAFAESVADDMERFRAEAS